MILLREKYRAKYGRVFIHDAGCLNRAAGIALREVQRATAGASTSTAAVGPGRRGVVCAPFWRDPECARAFALVHAGWGGGAGAAGAGVSRGAGG